MNEILKKMHEVAASPRAQMDKYLAEGKKIVLCAPVYTPEEIIHSMGFVPMGAWGGDMELNRAKEYCPAFLCAIVQSLLELGITGAFEGASAIVIPSLCDTLKTVGENWKYAVPSIPFIPMTYPQNRKPAYGVAYTKAGYERVIRDLEKLGGTFSNEKLAASNAVYNRHNAAMRKIDALLAVHPEITAAQRSDIFKSAFFMTKEEHTELVEACTSWPTTWPRSPASIAPTSPPGTTRCRPSPTSSPRWTTAPCCTTRISPASSGSSTPPRSAARRACSWY